MGLDTVEFILWAEKKYGIDIPDKDASEIYTVGEFCRYVADRLAVECDLNASLYQTVFDEVSHELIHSYGVKNTLITEHARFVDDLGLD